MIMANMLKNTFIFYSTNLHFRPLPGDIGDGSKWTRYVMCAPSFAVCGGIFKAVRTMPNQMVSAQFYCCPLPVDQFIDW